MQVDLAKMTWVPSYLMNNQLSCHCLPAGGREGKGLCKETVKEINSSFIWPISLRGMVTKEDGWSLLNFLVFS